MQASATPVVRTERGGAAGLPVTCNFIGTNDKHWHISSSDHFHLIIGKEGLKKVFVETGNEGLAQ